MEAVQIINFVLFISITVLFSYKLILGIIGIFSKKKFPEAKKDHTFAILIAGRNEEKVIGQLIESIQSQNYNQKLLKIFIVADNCTDKTAEVARLAGQRGDGTCSVEVFERFNTELVGKGYALDYLLEKIESLPDFTEDKYDAYLIFDADNLLDKNYIHEMNKVLDAGYDVSTSYRNSKNFNSNWISASTAMGFLRECRFMHTPRAILNSSTFISGTGFMVSSKILNTKTGWKYTTMTEDIEFSTVQISKGSKITYCDDAIFYDEQPTTFKASWNQRMRWQKGFYQCFSKYFLSLVTSLFSGHWFASYEMMLMLFPFSVVTIFWGIFYYIYSFIYSLISSITFTQSIFIDIIVGGLTTLLISYVVLALYGMLILLVERKRVKTTFWQKIKYSLMFPIFILSYLPIAVVCLFKKVKWKQIPHTDSRSIEDIENQKKGENQK